MIGFLLFLLVVSAAGFIYLTFQSRWQVKNNSEAFVISGIGESVIEQTKNAITIKAPNIRLDGAVQVPRIEDISNLPKSAPRINQAHWQTRTFERPRRKVKR